MRVLHEALYLIGHPPRLRLFTNPKSLLGAPGRFLTNRTVTLLAYVSFEYRQKACIPQVSHGQAGNL